jgi:electron transport complex protein RnfC
MLKTFRIGGVHPAENKFSAEASIEAMDFPKRVAIPVSQHLGVPAKVLVKRGDMVKTGQMIAKGEAFISANIHSPFTGKVFKVEDALDSTGFRRMSVIVDVQDDEWIDDINTSQEIKREINATPEEIVKTIHEKGIVGLGGATFPTHVKYMVPEGKKVEYLIINGVECEPYLTSDHRLMLEKGEEMMIGIQILMKGLKVNKCIIGVENNKPDAIAHLQNLASKFQGISIEALKVQYPQGGEKQLIDALLKRQVPMGKLPLEVGCVVNNVGTCFAVYEAVQKNKPLIERVVTVTGKTVKKPSNFMVRLGTPVTMLLEMAEADMEQTGKIINGGPMMGKALVSTDVPVTKGTSGILCMTKSEAKRSKEQNCIRCSKCTTVCPQGLEPHLLKILGKQMDAEASEIERVMDCIECGSCVYTCPANIPLLDYIRTGKAKTGEMIRNRSKK